MTNHELIATIELLAVPKAEIARRLSVSYRQLTRYCSGECKVPPWVGRDMGRMVDDHERAA